MRKKQIQYSGIKAGCVLYTVRWVPRLVYRKMGIINVSIQICGLTFICILFLLVLIWFFSQSAKFLSIAFCISKNLAGLDPNYDVGVLDREPCSNKRYVGSHNLEKKNRNGKNVLVSITFINQNTLSFCRQMFALDFNFIANPHNTWYFHREQSEDCP